MERRQRRQEDWDIFTIELPRTLANRINDRVRTVGKNRSRVLREILADTFGVLLDEHGHVIGTVEAGTLSEPEGR